MAVERVCTSPFGSASREVLALLSSEEARGREQSGGLGGLRPLSVLGLGGCCQGLALCAGECAGGAWADKVLAAAMSLSGLARSQSRGDVTCKSGSGCRLQIPCSRAGCCWNASCALCEGMK